MLRMLLVTCAKEVCVLLVSGVTSWWGLDFVVAVMSGSQSPTLIVDFDYELLAQESGRY